MKEGKYFGYKRYCILELLLLLLLSLLLLLFLRWLNANRWWWNISAIVFDRPGSKLPPSERSFYMTGGEIINNQTRENLHYMAILKPPQPMHTRCKNSAHRDSQSTRERICNENKNGLNSWQTNDRRLFFNLPHTRIHLFWYNTSAVATTYTQHKQFKRLTIPLYLSLSRCHHSYTRSLAVCHGAPSIQFSTGIRCWRNVFSTHSTHFPFVGLYCPKRPYARLLSQTHGTVAMW